MNIALRLKGKKLPTVLDWVMNKAGSPPTCAWTYSVNRMLALLLFHANQLRENLETFQKICAFGKREESLKKGSILVENYRHSCLLSSHSEMEALIQRFTVSYPFNLGWSSSAESPADAASVKQTRKHSLICRMKATNILFEVYALGFFVA